MLLLHVEMIASPHMTSNLKLGLDGNLIWLGEGIFERIRTHMFQFSNHYASNKQTLETDLNLKDAAPGKGG